MAMFRKGKRSSLDTQYAGTLIFDFLNARTVRNKCMLSKSLSLWNVLYQPELTNTISWLNDWIWGRKIRRNQRVFQISSTAKKNCDSTDRSSKFLERKHGKDIGEQSENTWFEMKKLLFVECLTYDRHCNTHTHEHHLIEELKHHNEREEVNLHLGITGGVPGKMHMGREAMQRGWNPHHKACAISLQNLNTCLCVCYSLLFFNQFMKF